VSKRLQLKVVAALKAPVDLIAVTPIKLLVVHKELVVQKLLLVLKVAIANK
jgi:hypothetical protein